MEKHYEWDKVLDMLRLIIFMKYQMMKSGRQRFMNPQMEGAY